jgi:hypothetical protein
MPKKISPDDLLTDSIVKGLDFYLPDPNKSELENLIIQRDRRQKLIDKLNRKRNGIRTVVG